jgi:hypothetical protein
LFASEQRALTLNKAYRVIVREQSFVDGRDATVTAAGNVHSSVEPGTATGIERAAAGY